MTLIKALCASLLLLAGSACANTPPTIAFGGYYFEAPTPPSFIGANAADALILLFGDKTKNATFQLEFYDNHKINHLSAEVFLDTVYGTATTTDKTLQAIKKSISENIVNISKTQNENILFYYLKYNDRDTTIIFDTHTPDRWTTITGSNVDIIKLSSSLKKI